jgi:hypothetical protein
VARPRLRAQDPDGRRDDRQAPAGGRGRPGGAALPRGDAVRRAGGSGRPRRSARPAPTRVRGRDRTAVDAVA